MPDLKDVIKADRQVKSKQRVADHGEVFTSEREVNAMLNLVSHETERIDSRFLEPACGTGNFLVEILKRKLTIVSSRYAVRRLRWEVYAAQAVCSVYGVDILQDNVNECRERLFRLVDQRYSQLFDESCTEEYRKIIRFLLERNILWGDALNLRTPDEGAKPIVFSEWGFIIGLTTKVKRRDFRLNSLLDETSEMPLFRDENNSPSELKPIKEYPLTSLFNLANDSGIHRH